MTKDALIYLEDASEGGTILKIRGPGVLAAVMNTCQRLGLTFSNVGRNDVEIRCADGYVAGDIAYELGKKGYELLIG